jgi:hypothetical protein
MIYLLIRICEYVVLLVMFYLGMIYANTFLFTGWLVLAYAIMKIDEKKLLTY